MPVIKRRLLLALTLAGVLLGPLAMMGPVSAGHSPIAAYLDHLKVLVFVALCATVVMMASPKHRD